MKDPTKTVPQRTENPKKNANAGTSSIFTFQNKSNINMYISWNEALTQI